MSNTRPQQEQVRHRSFSPTITQRQWVHHDQLHKFCFQIDINVIPVHQITYFSLFLLVPLLYCSFEGPMPVNVAEYEAYAAATLPRNAHGYYASGANDMITLRENRAAFSRLRIMPKILIDVTNIR